jgi:hypothetical protein
MGSIKPFAVSVVLLCTFVVHRSALGMPIDRSAFTAAATVESFEGIVNNTDLAIQTPFHFPSDSAVTLTGPVPSISGTFGPYIVGDGFFGLSSGQFVPDGKAYLGQSNPNLDTGPLEFTFATPMLRVGALFATSTPFDSSPASVTLEAIGANGTLLESVSVTGVQPQAWATDFVGIQRGEGIARLIVAGNKQGVLRMDDLTFEALPEPSGIALAAVALLLISRQKAGVRRNRH